MRVRFTVRDAGSGTERDLLVDADEETPVGEVVEAIGLGELWLDGRPLAMDAPVSRCGLRDGSVVGAGGPVRERARLQASAESAAVEVAAVGGPAAGRSWPAREQFTVGRDEASDIPLGDASASRVHARFLWAPNVDGADPGWVIEDAGSTNGTWVDGRRLSGRQPVGASDTLEVGATILEIRAPVAADADVQPAPDGSTIFNRPARLQAGFRSPKVLVPNRPLEGDRPPFPWLQAIAPLGMGAVLYLITKQIATLSFVVLSPVLIVSSTVTQRRRVRQKGIKDRETYRERTEKARSQAAEAARRELVEERSRWRDPAATAATAAGPNRRLWERRSYDPDALVLRIGLADRDSVVGIDADDMSAPPPSPGDPAPLRTPRLIAAPAIVPLRAVGVLGVAGPPSTTSALTRWLVAQLAVWHSPRDLEIVLLTAPEDLERWAWSRWLPHLRRDEPGAAPLAVGNDPASREQRVKELLKVLESREALPTSEKGAVWRTSIVVVMDGIRALRALPGVPRLLRNGPAVGIYIIGIDSDPARLAEEGRAQVTLDPGGEAAIGTIQIDGSEPVESVILDQVDDVWAEAVARHLAPLRDAGGDDGNSTIPSAVRFAELMALDLDDPGDVVGRWRAGGRTTSAVVGVSIDGPFALDLRRDGPHALVAGTTGSGKSEFLQTLVASLALANRPDAINFVLVDYKGASAFADCAELPHTAGLVTNLDGQGTQRALTSLEAELRRRERRLSELRAPDVDAAWDKDPNGAAAAGLARLVLVIDEFAELVHELPDFVTGLIRIARVGRSLGVHLILATQRPAGVVTGEMRANTGLRVALRMEDISDSQEVLEAGDAASISRATPGRAYARMGGGAAVIGFQAARVAGRRPGVAAGLAPPVVVPLPWNRGGYPLPINRRASVEDSHATDLHALVGSVREAAAAEGFGPPRSPWLPPLPEQVGLGTLDAVGTVEGMRVAYGIEDAPADQAQRPATFALEDGSHLVIAGSARSGRSTILRSLAASLARRVSPNEVHLYGFDFGNGALLPLTSLPHCGAVVTRPEVDRTARLLDRLIGELGRRQSLFAATGVGDIGEQRRVAPPGERLPYLVVLLDRWEGFTGTHSIESGSLLPGQVARLLQEGAGAGILVVIAGDRGLLTDRLASFVEERLVLRLANKEDYRLVNINPTQVAESPPPGRAMRVGSLTEVQVALVDGDGPLDPSAQAQAAAVASVGVAAADRWPAASLTNRPFRVDSLPTRITTPEVDALVASGQVNLPRPPAGDRPWAAIAVGGDDLSACCIDLAETQGFVVAGPARSGRSTALVQLARSAADAGSEVIAICPRPSPLSGLAGHPGVEVLVGVPEIADLEAPVKRVLAGTKPGLVVIDDAERFARCEADEVLRVTAQNVGAARLAIVVASTIDELKSEMRGVVAMLRKGSAGLLFSPQSSFDGDLVGGRLPKAMAVRAPAGRGCLASSGEWQLVQVPVPVD